jgi:YD repeat-containing protein
MTKVNSTKMGWALRLLLLSLFLSDVIAQADEVRYLYDDLGRLAAEIDAQGNAAIYTYDAVGNLLSITRRTMGQVAILGITPSRGTPGTIVTITGIGFSATPAENQVSFGGGVAAIVQSSSPTSLTTTVPEGTLTGPITVTTPTNSATSAQPFLVIPSITSITPNFGFAGSTITGFRITGSNLHGATAVQFTPSDGITAANPPQVSPDGTSVTVSVTLSATATIGLRVVTITTPDGTSTATATAQNSFTVLPNEPLLTQSEAVGVFVLSRPTETIGTATVGVFVEPRPGSLTAPYVGVQVTP